MKKMEEILVKTMEKAILMALRLPREAPFRAQESLKELEKLVTTAGGEVLTHIIQERRSPHPRTFIGLGKAKDLATLASTVSADLVVFNHNLSPSQQRNLEGIIPVKILDRTALILDIFAQRAHSAEGKLQVELAQYTYRLSRLRGRGIDLSRLGGGIGTRGPGETKLEVDLRRIRARVSQLKTKLEKLRKTRALQRQKRRKANLFNISLVGYTNAGKSSLLNVLTKAQVFVEDKLFATLDSTTRRLPRFQRGRLVPQLRGASGSHSASKGDEQQVVLSDTVGFIKDLPPELIAAFRSTLDEVREARLLLHIIDLSHPQAEEQQKVVARILSEIGAGEISRLDVFNKIDLLQEKEIGALKRRFPEGVFVSAKLKKNLDQLLIRIAQMIGKVKLEERQAA